MPETLWFTTARLTIHQSMADGSAGVSLIEHHMAQGFAVPLHVHHGEDETFFILDGSIRVRLGDAVLTLDAGQCLRLPGGTPHSFRVLSPEARFLTLSTGRFETMVRSLARPAEDQGLPPQVPPTAAEVDALVAACAAHDITFVGPAVD